MSRRRAVLFAGFAALALARHCAATVVVATADDEPAAAKEKPFAAMGKLLSLDEESGLAVLELGKRRLAVVKLGDETTIRVDKAASAAQLASLGADAAAPWLLGEKHVIQTSASITVGNIEKIVAIAIGHAIEPLPEGELAVPSVGPVRWLRGAEADWKRGEVKVDYAPLADGFGHVLNGPEGFARRPAATDTTLPGASRSSSPSTASTRPGRRPTRHRSMRQRWRRGKRRSRSSREL